jgi:hypothetical protein
MAFDKRSVALHDQVHEQPGPAVAVRRPPLGGIVERSSHVVGLGDQVTTAGGWHERSVTP